MSNTLSSSKKSNAPSIHVPPHSIEAEVSVLGALILDKDAVIAVAEFLKGDHFYDDRHKEIFEAIISLYEDRAPIDLLTVAEKLKKRKSLKRVGGNEYLSELLERVPTAAHVEHYGRIVKELAVKRALMGSATRLVEMSFDEGIGAAELLDKAESEIFSLTQTNVAKGFVSVRAGLADSFDRLDELHKMDSGLRGMPTGFKDLDGMLAGLQKSNLIILAARPGMGKCVTGDTLVLDPISGARNSIENIVNKKEARLLALDENLKLQIKKPMNFVYDGIKPVYKIRTGLGNTLEATAVHPLLTINGWKKLEELTVGDRIASPRKLDFFGKKTWEDYKIKCLAYLLGDGGLTGNNPIFTNKNERLLNDFASSVELFGNVKVRRVESKNRTPSLRVSAIDSYLSALRKEFSISFKNWLSQIGLSQNQLALDLGISAATISMWASGLDIPTKNNQVKLKSIWVDAPQIETRINPVTKWCKELGIMGKLSIEKEIPKEVFELEKTQIALLLNRLYGCEGSVILKGIRPCISFSSSAYKLAEEVKHLLLRFGILAKLRMKHINYLDGVKIAYEIEILNSKDILTFIKEIGIFGKEEKLEKARLVSEKRVTTKNWTKDTIPLDVWNLILKEKGSKTWREVYKLMNRKLSYNIHVNKRQLRRETLEEIALALNSKTLLNISQSDIYWDKIVSIEKTGSKPVYDLTINKLHNFVANDIIVHNTSLALNIAQHLSVNEKKTVAMFSLEMSAEELRDRLLIAQADIDAWKLKTGKLTEDDFTKLSNAMGELAEAPFYIDDTPALSILEMRTKARRLQVEYGIDLLIIDYLQLARSRNLENRVQEVSEISQGFKNLARELKIPVLALSQLSRAVESRGVKRPQLSDLRESGCLIGETLLIDPESGERRTIESLVGKNNFKVLTVDNNLKIVMSGVEKVFPSGKKMVYEMTLKSGKIIKASGNHPFLKVFGWERLDKLIVGDKIATPRLLNIKRIKNNILSDDRLILLAHLIGDGCFVKKQPLHYTNGDMKLIDIVKKSAMAEFNIKPRIVKQKNWYNLYLTAAEKLTHGKRNQIVKWLDEDLKIYGQHSREKQIPEIVFGQSNEKISVFLRNLWSTDGCIFIYKGKTKSKVSIYYASGSHKLAENVSHLLLRLGILSTITISTKNGYKDMYNVQIQGKIEQLKFLENVGCVGKKSDKVRDAIVFLNKIKENPNNDIVPKEIWQYIEELRIKKGLTTREFHKEMGWAYSGTRRHRNGIGRVRLTKIARFFNDEKLKSISESDLYWDEIVKIEKVGIRDVYDMTVPKYSNFVANDMIVHNSIEQDADVVMFLWREDEEDVAPGKPMNYTLDIAKHRNGPLGNVKLSFHGDRIKFFGRDMKRTK